MSPTRSDRRPAGPARRPGPDRGSGRSGRSGILALGGRRPVLEAIRSGRATRVLMSHGSHATEGLRDLMEAAEQAGVELEDVEATTLDEMGLRNHQGVAAVVSLPSELGEGDLEAMAFDADAVVVVLDGITDPQNLGASARSAEAAGAVLLVARKRRAAPLTPAAVRASAGALLHLPVVRVTNIPRTLERLRERGFFVAGLDHRAEVDVHAAPAPSRPLALVVGAEDVGLSRLVRETCDVLVSIPMRGRTASLNASAALSVGLFAYALRPDHPKGDPNTR